MAKKAEPSRVAAALQYLQQMRDRAADFGGGVVDTLADRARDVGGLAYEAFTSDPNIGRMTTAEYAQAADRPTPRLDQAAQDLGTIGKAIVTQPIQTGKALVQGEVERARQAMTSPRAAGEYAGSMVDPLRLASALRRGPMLELDVYHGSPHRFEEFDASKIGTGEGAQAYGHGIYLAESPKVAANYRSQLAPGTIRTIDGGDYDPANPEHIAAKYLNTFSQRNYSLQKIADLLEEDASLLQQEGHKKAAEIVRSGKVEKLGKVGHRPSGALYTADLPDEMVDRMLDWDKPLSEQPKAVQQITQQLRELPGDPYNLKRYFNPKNPNKGPLGQDVYRAIAEHFEKDDAAWQALGKTPHEATNIYDAASQYAAQLGIPGIRYLDAGSRGQGGSGTRNFVVFPGEEKKVKILKRE